jgi:5S rRNA maturation endonuclease (ribonuclease M5)
MAMERIFDLLDFFEVNNYYQSGELLVSTCPVHDGDNFSAFNININEDSEFYGIWFCNTKKCHECHGRDILSLIQALLSNKTNKKCSFRDMVLFVESFCKSKKKTKRIKKPMQKSVSTVNKKNTKDHIRKFLEIPSKEYINRGFKKETLDEFDVGLCTMPNSEMYNRVVFPVYNESGDLMVGCVGRSTDDSFRWRNQKNFNIRNYLYNHSRALDTIAQTSTVVIVEGQGGVLRLWESGIKNAVGLFGSKLSDVQEFLLQKMNVDKLIIITDNDKAGERCREDIHDRLSYQFDIHDLRSTNNDIEDMSVEEIHKTIKPEIERIINE